MSQRSRQEIKAEWVDDKTQKITTTQLDTMESTSCCVPLGPPASGTSNSAWCGEFPKDVRVFMFNCTESDGENVVINGVSYSSPEKAKTIMNYLNGNGMFFAMVTPDNDLGHEIRSYYESNSGHFPPITTPMELPSPNYFVKINDKNYFSKDEVYRDISAGIINTKSFRINIPHSVDETSVFKWASGL